MGMTAPKVEELIGQARPRIGPPVPLRSEIAKLREAAAGLVPAIPLRPWQEYASSFLMATDPAGYPLFREVAIVVARQNGKTTLAKPFIVHKLREGRRIAHIAQVRELPRKMFGLVAGSLDESLFPKRRGKGGKMQTIWPRFGSGSEEILLANGGEYRIAAANRGGARGFTNDIVIIDELREMESNEMMDAAESTILTSPWGQIVYFSNAGTDESVVLNALRARAGNDPSLAYLEWSADPDLDPSDPVGWVQANPSIGHDPVLLGNLERAYRKHKLAGTMSAFETENLCRWVVTMRQRLVDEAEWAALQRSDLVPSKRSFLGVSMDPSGSRASAALAWQEEDGAVGLRLLLDGTGNPIEPDLLGADLRTMANKAGVRDVAYDPMTDAELAKFFKKTRKVSGPEWANASANFVNLVKSGKLHWQDAAAVTDDLAWTSRKEHDASGSFQAVRAKDDRPITAALASIRAVWLASGPRPTRPRIY